MWNCICAEPLIWWCTRRILRKTARYDAVVLLRWLRPDIPIRALVGFLLSGFLFALTGALLPAWGYDVQTDYATAGRYFLSVTAGMLAAGTLVGKLRKKLSPRAILTMACTVASLGLVALAMLPDQFPWHALGLAIIGTGAGFLHTGLFEAILPIWERSPATTIILGGIFFGGGSVASALLIAGTYYAYSLPTILLILAAVPAGFAFLYVRTPFPRAGLVAHPLVVKQFRSGAAILFSLLLLFQFGNEWSVAGWLPIFLVHRLGLSPASALKFLAAYFGWLTAGRVLMYYLLPRTNPWRLLVGSAAASLLGCLMLVGTNNRLGAAFATALLGLGFAAIYPLTAAWIGRRFPYYHPGYFNGIFSFALAGGMLAPWIIGEIADRAETWSVLTLPAFGTVMVVFLLLLIWVEGKVSGE